MKHKSNKGFTLIELLVVILIIAVLAVIVFVALNPTKRIDDAQSSKRWNHINSLLTGIHECIVDNDGVISSCLSGYSAGTKYEIVLNSQAGSCNATCSGLDSATDCLAIGNDLAAYLKELPVDPEETTANHTGYQVEVDSNNIVTLTACHADTPYTYEGNNDIQVSR